jgi:hypothetical protein
MLRYEIKEKEITIAVIVIIKFTLKKFNLIFLFNYKYNIC